MQGGGIDYRGCEKTLGAMDMFLILIIVTRYAKIIQFYTFVYSAYYTSTVTP